MDLTPVIDHLKAQAKAAVKPVDSTTSIQAYLNSARTLRLHAESYRKHDNPQHAFLYLYRLAYLLLTVLPTHKEWKGANEDQRRLAQGLAQEALDLLEAIKPSLAMQQEQQKRLPAALPFPQPKIPSRTSPAATNPPPAPLPPHPTPSAPPPAPATAPLLMRDTSLRTALEGLTTSNAASSGTASPYPSISPTAKALVSTSAPTSSSASLGHSVAGAGAYPSVSPVHNNSHAHAAAHSHWHPTPGLSSLLDPASPYAALHTTIAPAAVSASVDTSASRASGSGLSPAGVVVREQLRPIVLPSSLIQVFSRLAERNTYLPPRGIETCGILAGYEAFSEPERVIGGGVHSARGGSSSSFPTSRLVVTHLIMPRQQAGADHCEMTPEGEDMLLDYCLSEGLITVGWIHTHPSQQCFMSSMDMHCQSGYQSSLPEAVAIVVAPTDERMPFAAFRLTDEPGASGLEVIQRCPMTGFHPHDGVGFWIYEIGGHAQWQHPTGSSSGTGSLTVKDMR